MYSCTYNTVQIFLSLKFNFDNMGTKYHSSIPLLSLSPFAHIIQLTETVVTILTVVTAGEVYGFCPYILQHRNSSNNRHGTSCLELEDFSYSSHMIITFTTCSLNKSKQYMPLMNSVYVVHATCCVESIAREVYQFKDKIFQQDLRQLLPVGDHIL